MSASTLKGSTLQYIYNQIKKFGKGGGGGGGGGSRLSGY